MSTGLGPNNTLDYNINPTVEHTIANMQKNLIPNASLHLIAQDQLLYPHQRVNIN